MKESVGSIFVTVGLLVHLLSGCAPTSAPVQPNVIEESNTTPLIADLTGNSEYPAIAFDKGGETLVIIGGDTNGSISGAIWDSPQGDAVVVYTDEKHLPAMLVVGDYVLVYTNYTDTTVDITLVSSDGAKESFPQTQIDQNYYQGILTAQTPITGTTSNISFRPSTLSNNDELWHFIKLGSLSLGTAVCVSGVILSAGITVALSAACAGVLIKAIALEQEQYSRDRITPLESADVALDAFGCAIGSSPADCIDVVIDSRDALHQNADATIHTNVQNIVDPTPTLAPTDAPAMPILAIYDGVSTACNCTNCSCDSSPSFHVELTLEPNGNVNGVFYKYTEFFGDFQITGTRDNITGKTIDINGQGVTLEFVGSLSADNGTLVGKLVFDGNTVSNVYGERELLLTKSN